MPTLCDLCGGKYEEVSRRQIGNTAYYILRCEKCGHQIARQK